MISEHEAFERSAVYRQLQGCYRIGYFDLTSLWNVAGRKPGQSPRQWAIRQGEPLPKGDPHQPCLVDEGTANLYAASLCPVVMMRMNQVLMDAFKADPVKHLATDPTGLVAQLILGPRVAGRQELVAEAIERTQGLDELTRETLVARVQRAVGSPK